MTFELCIELVYGADEQAQKRLVVDAERAVWGSGHGAGTGVCVFCATTPIFFLELRFHSKRTGVIFSMIFSGCRTGRTLLFSERSDVIVRDKGRRSADQVYGSSMFVVTSVSPLYGADWLTFNPLDPANKVWVLAC